MSTSLASEDLGTILTPTKCDNSEGNYYEHYYQTLVVKKIMLFSSYECKQKVNSAITLV